MKSFFRVHFDRHHGVYKIGPAILVVDNRQHWAIGFVHLGNVAFRPGGVSVHPAPWLRAVAARIQTFPGWFARIGDKIFRGI